MYGTLIARIALIRGWAFHRAPIIVGATLVVLIAAESIRVALTFSSPGRESLPLPARLAAAPSGVSVQAIVEAHLFGVAAASRRDPGDAPVSTANLVLSGTIATRDANHGYAIIADAGRTKVYSVGDDVAGASLYSVYADRVVLDRGGAFETLVLRRLLGAGRGPQLGRNAAPPPRDLGVFVDNLGRAVKHEPGILDKMIRAVDTYDDKDAKVRGFKIYPVSSGASLRALGLLPGDLVTAINGEQLNDARRGKEVLESIKSSDSPTVTVERQGHLVNLTLNVSSGVLSIDKGPAPDASGTEEPVSVD